ncbi:MAG: Trm112 family protein [bacterium]|nr:Trm112 family protein [bacterium]
MKNILVCPACRGGLSFKLNVIVCRNCNRTYPVCDSIPQFDYNYKDEEDLKEDSAKSDNSYV